MSRNEFVVWFAGITDEDVRISIAFCLAEGVYGDDFTDEEGMAKLRQHVYEIFPEFHEESYYGD